MADVDYILDFTLENTRSTPPTWTSTSSATKERSLQEGLADFEDSLEFPHPQKPYLLEIAHILQQLKPETVQVGVTVGLCAKREVIWFGPLPVSSVRSPQLQPCDSPIRVLPSVSLSSPPTVPPTVPPVADETRNNQSKRDQTLYHFVLAIMESPLFHMADDYDEVKRAMVYAQMKLSGDLLLQSLAFETFGTIAAKRANPDPIKKYSGDYLLSGLKVDGWQTRED
ncbi:hypothetical protein HDV05_002240 [Chytridiales sp. JEL 0842]|nr:hypothetical protein HDV05_002240 [Chytridiales sp. JEL 0842]